MPEGGYDAPSPEESTVRRQQPRLTQLPYAMRIRRAIERDLQKSSQVHEAARARELEGRVLAKFAAERAAFL